MTPNDQRMAQATEAGIIKVNAVGSIEAIRAHFLKTMMIKDLFLTRRDDREKALKNQTNPVPKTVLFLTRPRGYADTGRH